MTLRVMMRVGVRTGACGSGREAGVLICPCRCPRPYELGHRQ